MNKTEELHNKVRKWILTKADAVERDDFMDLLYRNEELVIKLYRAEQRHDDLRKAYHELQKEIGKSCPRIPIMSAAEAYRNPQSMEVICEARWSMDPLHVRKAYPEEQTYMYRQDIFPRIHEAFKYTFHETIVPQLWAETERHLSEISRKT